MRTVLVIFLALIGGVFGTRNFFRGKLFRSPPTTTDLRSTDNTLWFDQLLDHFEPTNDATWKQVRVGRCS